MHKMYVVLFAHLAIGTSGQLGPPKPAVPPPPAHTPAQPLALPRRVPQMPPGFPYHAGGWFGRAPDADLLPGWWAIVDDAGDWIFYPEGRFGVEASYYNPRVLASVECIAPGHPLYANSFPIANG